MVESLYKQELMKQINQKKSKRLEEEEANKSYNQDNQLSFVKKADLKRK